MPGKQAVKTRLQFNNAPYAGFVSFIDAYNFKRNSKK